MKLPKPKVTTKTKVAGKVAAGVATGLLVGAGTALAGRERAKEAIRRGAERLATRDGG